ncbi:MAG TPA: polysaccharide biosynthesis tyrosine autokinase [Puia sp.]|nr:polysaccharide biosynthesis tyrosine autokinase [Puia sp.]
MIENKNEPMVTEVGVKPNNKLSISPKELIFRYLHYLPWVIVSVILFMIMAYLKIRWTTPIFQVQSSLLIKSEQDNFASSKDDKFSEMILPQTDVNLRNEMAILKSRPVIARVVKDLDLQYLSYNKGTVRSTLLYPVSPFSLRLTRIADSAIGFGCQITVLNENRFLLNESKTSHRFGDTTELDGSRFVLLYDSTMGIHSMGSAKFEFSWLPLPAAVENLLGSLKITQTDDQTTILTLIFEHENPMLGKNVLNTLMSVYDSLIVENKNRISANTLQFIDDRLYELNDTLRGVEGVLRNFMVANQAFDIEGQSKAFLDKEGDEANSVVTSGVKIGIVNWLLDYVANKKNQYELVPTALGIDEPALLQLITEYNKLQLEREANLKTSSETNPMILAMDGTLEKTRRNIYQALLNVKQAYAIASEGLQKQNQTLQERIASLPGKSMRLLNIERQQKILEELYSFLLQKKLETSIAAAATVSNSRVIEAALDSKLPISPNKKSVYTFYLLLGVLIPVGIIVVIELLHDKVSSREDIERITSAPILGEIGHSRDTQSLVVNSNSRRFIAEQFRIVRTNLQYIVGRKDRPVIMVTSSFSGEGKSFISTNLGAVMALSGKRTVIMEFDIRKPKIVSGLDLKRNMGITNYIIGKASFEDLLLPVGDFDNLFVIPCGPIPPNPSELLLDKRLGELMAEVKAHFDVVIMDTAPVGLVADAINLSQYIDAAVYIVRQRHTFKKQLELIDELYNNNKLPNLCVLLNDVRVEGGYYSGYGYYGGYGYGYRRGSGYFEENEERKKRSVLGKLLKWFTWKE